MTAPKVWIEINSRGLPRSAVGEKPSLGDFEEYVPKAELDRKYQDCSDWLEACRAKDDEIAGLKEQLRKLESRHPPRVSGAVAYCRCKAWRELSGDAEGIPGDVYDWMWLDKRAGSRDFTVLDARALEISMGAQQKGSGDG